LSEITSVYSSILTPTPTGVLRGGARADVRGHAEAAAATKVVSALLAVALGLARVCRESTPRQVSVSELACHNAGPQTGSLGAR
jgi:hypothetical protein